MSWWRITSRSLVLALTCFKNDDAEDDGWSSSLQLNCDPTQPVFHFNSICSFSLLDLSLSELTPVSDPYIARIEALDRGLFCGSTSCSTHFWFREKPGEWMEVKSVLVGGRSLVAMLPLEPLAVLFVEVVAVND